MNPLLWTMDGHAAVAQALTDSVGAAAAEVVRHRFPDGERYLRVETPVQDRDVILLCNLDHANEKFLELLLAAETFRDLGARRIGLVAPYLGYMRQDIRFHPGEGITSRYFAAMLSRHFDWLVTVDPHLHRYHALSEIYRIPARAVHAAPAVIDFLRGRDDLFLLGPDAESEQWVSEIGRGAALPWAVATKVRHGDRQVSLNLPDLDAFRDKQPLLVDDVISSGGTLRKAIGMLREQGFAQPACLCVHALLAEDAEEKLVDAGAAELISANTLVHGSNRIDVAPAVAAAVQEMLK